MTKSRLIVNPTAGADEAPNYLLSMNEQLRSGGALMDIVITLAEGDARLAAQQALHDGYDQLFIAGGDGTLNEVVNGVAQVDGGFDRVTFGVVPLGTGNDFATALGIPDDVDRAIALLLAGHVRRVDVGRLNEHYFVNVSAGGFLAEVSDAVRPQLKSVAGKLAYLIGGAEALLDHEPMNARLVTACPGVDWTHTPLDDGAPVSLEAFAVCNSRLVGGGRLIAPSAVLDDGLLDVCLIHEMPIVEFIGLIRKVSEGGHVADERVTYFRAREIELAFDRAIMVNVDGQVLETDRCRYSILPRAARFLASQAR